MIVSPCDKYLACVGFELGAKSLMEERLKIYEIGSSYKMQCCMPLAKDIR